MIWASDDELCECVQAAGQIVCVWVTETCCCSFRPLFVAFDVIMIFDVGLGQWQQTGFSVPPIVLYCLTQIMCEHK